MELFLYALILYLFTGIIQAFIPGKIRSVFMVIGAGVSSTLLTLLSLRILLSGNTKMALLQFPFPWREITVSIDPLSAFFILVIAVISFLAAIYSAGYLKPYYAKNQVPGTHLFFMNLLIVSMLLVTTIQNGLTFLVVWEIMSISSFFLVFFEHEKKEVFNAAIQYLVAMHIGVIFLIGAFVLLYIHTGSLAFSALERFFNQNPQVSSLVFIFYFIGFGTKAGFIPFHVWLPEAHPAAPAHISGIMSALMIKTGIYGILRVISFTHNPPPGLGYFVLGISLVSALIGILYASVQKDIKRFLAYSSIENIGIIGLGIGTGMLGLSFYNYSMAFLGFGGALFHLLNHSIFKSLLFFSSGSIYGKLHHKNMEKMGGLIHRMPYTAVFTLIGSAAICALPPFNGFSSEFLLYFSMIKGIHVPGALVKTASILSIAGLSFVGATALIAFTRMYGITFLGVPRENLSIHDDENKSTHNKTTDDSHKAMLTVMGILAVFALALGLFPKFGFMLMKHPLRVLTMSDEAANMPFPDFLGKISFSLFLFLGMFLFFFLLRRLILKNREVRTYKTWDCAYQKATPRMQYTASSYSRIFALLFKPFLKLDFSIHSSPELFPSHWKLETHFRDAFDRYIISPVTRSIKDSVKWFSWIQRGSTQQYILYGLLFLLAAILWILGTS